MKFSWQVLEELVSKVLKFDKSLSVVDAMHIISPLYPQIGKLNDGIKLFLFVSML